MSAIGSIRAAKLAAGAQELRAIDLRPGLSDLGMALTILSDCGAEALALVEETAKAALAQLQEEQRRVERVRDCLIGPPEGTTITWPSTERVS